jgi:hypothetical protein
MDDGIDQKLRKKQLQKIHESRTYNPSYKSIIDHVFPGEVYQELSDEDEDEAMQNEDEQPEDLPRWRMDMLQYDPNYQSGDDGDYVPPSKIVRRRITKKPAVYVY